MMDLAIYSGDYFDDGCFSFGPARSAHFDGGS